MSAICQVTGVKPAFGNRVSHSHRRSSRRWHPNIQTRGYWVASQRRWVRIRVSARGMKVIDKRGIDAVIAELRANGVKL